ncbi:MAG: glutamate synthase subunit alpha, partial [Cyanobacteriota bacterium]|nr:glutamate synthase subunit alpha [Cyanobacteriota bacterium]
MNYPSNPSFSPATIWPNWGPRFLVEERDACGVGFLADQYNRPSHRLVQQAMAALEGMEHRGGCCADQDSGDGAGVMTAIPWEILQQWARAQGLTGPEPEAGAVGMIFLPQLEAVADRLRQLVNQVIAAEGLTLVGWRPVPVDPEVLGPLARRYQPRIEQVVVTASDRGEALERRLYLLRRQVLHSLATLLEPDNTLTEGERQALQEFYICSFSSRTIVYKGMVRSAVLADFYADLRHPDYRSAFVIYHRRFSTNTLPKWPLAHPMRLLGHNGEINTLVGNINWMVARQADLAHPIWGDRLAVLKP